MDHRPPQPDLSVSEGDVEVINADRGVVYSHDAGNASTDPWKSAEICPKGKNEL